MKEEMKEQKVIAAKRFLLTQGERLALLQGGKLIILRYHSKCRYCGSTGRSKDGKCANCGAPV